MTIQMRVITTNERVHIKRRECNDRSDHDRHVSGGSRGMGMN